MNVAAVILAAGASTRMGRPKALLEWKGRPFFVSCVELARGAACAPVIVVDGATRLTAPPGAHVTHNARWSRGPLGSLQLGMRAALDAVTPLGPVSGIAVLTVDRPHIALSTLQALLAAHERHRDAFVQAAFEGRAAHPVLYPRSLAEAALTLGEDETPRTLLRSTAVREQRVLVDVDDAAVLDNVDTPAEYDALCSA